MLMNTISYCLTFWPKALGYSLATFLLICSDLGASDHVLGQINRVLIFYAEISPVGAGVFNKLFSKRDLKRITT